MRKGFGKILRILVRCPSRNLEKGIVTHQERKQVDFTLAKSQWNSYVKTIKDLTSCSVVSLPADDDLPDGVFVEDVLLHLNGGFIVTNPGNSSRKLEIPSAVATLRELYNGSLRSIISPGSLDGGDVLISPPLNTIFVGLSARTNAAGFEQLSSFTRSEGYNLVGVPISKVLHLKSALTALPDGRLVGWLDGLDSESLKVLPNVISMPEEQGAHVVVIDDQTLLLSSSAPRSAALLKDMGYRVVLVEISEFEKLDGCVTCLSVRVRKS